MAYIHSFAKVWLKKLDNKILINDTDFFKINVDKLDDKFDIQPLHSYINVGADLIDQEDKEEIKHISYGDMQTKFGLTVFKHTIKGKGWHKQQKDYLVIGRKRPGLANELGDKRFISRGLKIEWNPIKQSVRGVGDNFTDKDLKIKDITPWYFYGDRRKKSSNLNPVSKYNTYSDISEDLFDSWEHKEKTFFDKIKIKKELPIMITEEGYLLCLPYDRELYRMLMVGMMGSGKSFALNRLLGLIHYGWQEKVGLLNDSLNQFYDLSLEQDKIGLIRELSRVGNEPRNLPVVNLYMSCPHLKMKYEDEHMSYRLVISFRDFLKNWSDYAKGIPEWDIKGKSMYIDDDVINGLTSIDKLKDIKKHLFAKLTAKQGDGKPLDSGKVNMVMKWCAALSKVLDDEFTSNLFLDEKTTAPSWKLIKADGQEITGHPFIVLMEAGCLPVINNYLAKDRPIASKQLSRLIRKIIRHQMHKDEKKPMWVGIDELKDFLEKSQGKELYQALDYLFTQGRFNQVGFIGNVQEYSRLTNSMRHNSTHLFIYEMGSKKERKEIADDYQLDKEKLDSIGKLEKHQCLLASRKKIVLYNKDGIRKVVDRGMWKGKVLPPITLHKSAGE